MSKVLLSPHNDDEALWCAYSIMLHRPLVVVVYDSYIQVARGAAYCDWETRRLETLRALTALTQQCDGYGDVRTPAIQPVFLGFRDDTEYTPMRVIDALQDHGLVQGVTELWAPAWEPNGHDQHNVVACAALGFNCPDLHRYTTYTRTGGRTRAGFANERNWTNVSRVDPTPDMIARKHRALSCYTSQITNPSCRPWFTGDLEEYLID